MTFLVPVSALLWGYVLLEETLSLQVIAGMVITLLGTAIATKMLRFRPSSLSDLRLMDELRRGFFTPPVLVLVLVLLCGS